MRESGAVKFLLDEHMPAVILSALQKSGIDATSIDELRLKSTRDPRILSIARAAGRVIVSRDSDFVDLAHQGVEHAGIVFASALSVGEIIRALRLVHGAMQPGELENRVEYASGLM